MAEEKKIATGYVGNALRSSAADHTTTFSDEVFDTERQKYQSEVNIDIEGKIVTEQERAEAAEQANAQGIIYDVSARNDGAVFESISALLSSSDLSTLIPTSVRRGGMTIRFIQGSEQRSDNKYVQYRLVTNEFTTDTTQWVIADEGIYMENPEFVYVKTDKYDKILWAIKTDGSIYYGAGVPPQIIDYINEKIEELSLDEYENIVAFLNGLEEGDKTLQTLLNEKVDKVEGKSLIDAEYADGVSQIESPEFAEVHTDAENKILYGVKKEGGDFYFG